MNLKEKEERLRELSKASKSDLMKVYMMSCSMLGTTNEETLLIKNYYEEKFDVKLGEPFTNL